MDRGREREVGRERGRERERERDRVNRSLSRMEKKNKKNVLAENLVSCSVAATIHQFPINDFEENNSNLGARGHNAAISYSFS